MSFHSSSASSPAGAAERRPRSRRRRSDEHELPERERMLERRLAPREVPEDQDARDPHGGEVRESVAGVHPVQPFGALLGERPEEVRAHVPELVLDDVDGVASGDGGEPLPRERVGAEAAGDERPQQAQEEPDREGVRPFAVPREELQVEAAVRARGEADRGAVEDVDRELGVVGLDHGRRERRAADGVLPLGSLDGDLPGVDDGAEPDDDLLLIVVERDLVLLPEVGAEADGAELESDVALAVDAHLHGARDLLGDLRRIGVLRVGLDVDVVLVEEAVELEVERVGQDARGAAEDEEDRVALQGRVDRPRAEGGDRHAGHEVRESFHRRAPFVTSGRESPQSGIRSRTCCRRWAAAGCRGS